MNNSDKQRLLIEYLLSSPDTFALCNSIIKPEYFNPEFRHAIEFIDMYYTKYSTLPPTKIIKSEFGLVFDVQQITRDEIEYCTHEIEKFCQYKGAELAVIKASKLLKEGKTDQIEPLIKEAAAISLTKDLGDSYFRDIRARLDRMSKTPQRTSTGWKSIDDLLGGGTARSELFLLSAGSGGGKSISLANIALNHVKQQLNVLYISLELSQDLVQQRFDTMISGIPSVNWKDNIDKIVYEAEKLGDDVGELMVIRMPGGTNANAIRGLLKEYQLKKGYVPDTIIVDYLDLMGTNNYVPPGNVFEKDKQATEELRDILESFQCLGFTASQLNRSAIDAEELNQGHIAGGISKVNTTDWYFSIVLNPAMKARGEILFVCLKSRSSDAVGKQVLLEWDNTNLIVRDMNQRHERELEEMQKFNSKLNTNISKSNLLDIMDI